MDEEFTPITASFEELQAIRSNVELIEDLYSCTKSLSDRCSRLNQILRFSAENEHRLEWRMYWLLNKLYATRKAVCKNT